MSAADFMSTPLTERQARRSEIDLMRGRLGWLVKRDDLNADERIGACRALKVLDARYAELVARDEETKA